MSMEQWWTHINSGKQKYSEENLPHATLSTINPKGLARDQTQTSLMSD
jgi:hypothetical protein